jgi:hypothetical protein
MSAIILEVRLDPGASEQTAGEYELTAGLSPEGAWRSLPANAGQALAPHREAFIHLHQGLLADLELTRIKRVRFVAGMKSATRLAPGPEAGSFTACLAVPALSAGPLWGELMAELLKAQALYPDPQDTRLPRRFAPLARTVAPLRHLLARIRELTRRNPDLTAFLLDPLGGKEPDHPLDPLGQTRQLLARFLSREDWRERDVFHLLSDFIQGNPHLFDEALLNTWFSLKRLQDEDARRLTPGTLAALINEGRAYLGRVASLAGRAARHTAPPVIGTSPAGTWSFKAVAGPPGPQGRRVSGAPAGRPGPNGLTWTELQAAAAAKAAAKRKAR